MCSNLSEVLCAAQGPEALPGGCCGQLELPGGGVGPPEDVLCSTLKYTGTICGKGEEVAW